MLLLISILFNVLKVGLQGRVLSEYSLQGMVPRRVKGRVLSEYSLKVGLQGRILSEYTLQGGRPPRDRLATFATMLSSDPSGGYVSTRTRTQMGTVSSSGSGDGRNVTL